MRTNSSGCRWIDRAKSPSRRPCPVQHNSRLSLKRSFPLNARRNTKSRIATHGFPHPIHNIRLPSRLRGQYVCSKSPATLCSAKFASTHPTSFLFLPLGKMLVVLRDGRKLHGVLRSYDQFGTHRSCTEVLNVQNFPSVFSKPCSRGHGGTNIRR